MTRSFSNRLQSAIRRRRESPPAASQNNRATALRPLRLEYLESRRLLAIFTVDNLDDGPVEAAGERPGTLRQAVFDANASDGTADTIQFADGLYGTILLTEGELTISDSLTIEGPGAIQLTVAAFDPTPEQKNGDGNRIFNVDDDDAGSVLDVSISGLTLTGGDVAGDGGGAIISYENLTIAETVITGNSAFSEGGLLNAGGAILGLRGDLTILNSTLHNNRVFHDRYSVGGAIAFGRVISR